MRRIGFYAVLLVLGAAALVIGPALALAAFLAFLLRELLDQMFRWVHALEVWADYAVPEEPEP